MKNLNHKILIYCFILLILFFMTVSSVLGENNNERTIIVKQGETIRDLADKYLGDPNLWIEILKKNNLNSPAEIQANMTLQLPDQIIGNANNQLKLAQQAIDEASKAGAKIFVPHIVAEAIRLQNDALAKRKEGNWDICFQQASAALEKAKEALENSLIQSNVASEAILSDKKGTVQSRKPSDNIWNDLPINSVLVEGEKVRTLSESYAEIRFKDNKQVRLNENSQIVISKIRMNLLKNEEESSVSLYKGDAYVLLSNNRQKEKFDLDVPGVSTLIDSKRFRVKTDETETQFANYDGKLEISTGDNTVVVGKNQISKIAGEKTVVLNQELLPPPKLVSPTNGTTILLGPKHQHIRFEWDSIADANGYWLEISTDRSFKKVILNQKEIKETFFEQAYLQDGAYYWQVAATNQSGFPGANSRAQFFKIINDTDPPYLMIRSPSADAIVGKNPVNICGEVESGALLSLKGNEIRVRADGAFRFEYPLEKGINEIVLEARDKAGNVSKLNRSFIFIPKIDVKIKYDPSLPQIAAKHFITHTPGFTLIGKTDPRTGITVYANKEPRQQRFECFTGDNGDFQLNLPVRKAKTEFALVAKSLNGHITRDTFIVEMDNQAPDIQLVNEPSSVSAVKDIHLSGSLSEPGKLKLETTFPISDFRFPISDFDTTVEIKAGMNTIYMTAADQAGNISFLEKKIILDQNPPKFLNFSLSPKTVSGGESLYITVSAEDESGLKASAQFAIQAGEFVHSGFLKWNRISQSYEGMVHLPKQVAGEVSLSYVTLSDYNGNEKEYHLSN